MRRVSPCPMLTGQSVPRCVAPAMRTAVDPGLGRAAGVGHLETMSASGDGWTDSRSVRDKRVPSRPREPRGAASRGPECAPRHARCPPPPPPSPQRGRRGAGTGRLIASRPIQCPGSHPISASAFRLHTASSAGFPHPPWLRPPDRGGHTGGPSRTTTRVTIRPSQGLSSHLRRPRQTPIAHRVTHGVIHTGTSQPGRAAASDVAPHTSAASSHQLGSTTSGQQRAAQGRADTPFMCSHGTRGCER